MFEEVCAYADEREHPPRENFTSRESTVLMRALQQLRASHSISLQHTRKRRCVASIASLQPLHRKHCDAPAEQLLVARDNRIEIKHREKT